MAIKFLNKTNANDISVVQNSLAVGGDFTPEDLLHIRGYSDQNMGPLDTPTIRIEDASSPLAVKTIKISNSAGQAKHYAPNSVAFHVGTEFSLSVLEVTTDNTGASRTDGSVGVLTSSPKAALDVRGGVRIANDSDAPSGDKAGTMRYREIEARGEVTRSRLEICMRIGNQPGNVSQGVYQWVIIQENVW